MGLILPGPHQDMSPDGGGMQLFVAWWVGRTASFCVLRHCGSQVAGALAFPAVLLWQRARPVCVVSEWNGSQCQAMARPGECLTVTGVADEWRRKHAQ